MHHEQDDKHDRGQRKRNPRVVSAKVVCETLRWRFLLLRHFNQVKNPAKCALPSRRVARITDCPSRLSVPPLTTSPICFTTGIASPVDADSSAGVAPSIITPSTGKKFAGLHEQLVSDLHLFNGSFYPATVFTPECVFRRDFEQRLDRFACAIICELLQPIAQRKQKEQRRAFGPSVNEQRADRDRHHQELDVDVALLERVPDILSGEPSAAHISESKERHQHFSANSCATEEKTRKRAQPAQASQQ